MGRSEEKVSGGTSLRERLGWECVGTHKGEHRGQCDRCMSHNGINRFRLSQCGCTHKQDIFGIKMSPDVYKFYNHFVMTYKIYKQLFHEQTF